MLCGLDKDGVPGGSHSAHSGGAGKRPGGRARGHKTRVNDAGPLATRPSNRKLPE